MPNAPSYRLRGTREIPVDLSAIALLLSILLMAGCTGRAASQQPETTPASQENDTGGQKIEPSEETSNRDAKSATNTPDVPLEHPFTHRTAAPDFPKDATWINTGGPIRLRDVKGKFVLLDFWTYCCINCIHILPELKKLEQAYANQLVVIGVHSAKFETEKDSKNIEEAVLRYEIEHPIVNDSDHRIWDSYFVRSWPSLRLIDPEGNLVAGDSGEFQFEHLDAFFQRVLPYYRKNGLLDESPVRFDLLAHRQSVTPLRFPGKVLADGKSDRLFIADSNHNRIVISSLDGRLIEIMGSGIIGRQDGGYQEASFDHPQGMALHGETLYVADTENHLIRKIDLSNKSVSTIAGIGEQGRNPWPGQERLSALGEPTDGWVGKPLETALNSPWALWIHDDDLYIAMAGPHQIWRMSLDESEIGLYAGNGREDIVDGPLLPDEPYATGFASFAQPSGLASDGTWLYVADSEGSSIRAVPLDPTKEVTTVVGTSQLPGGRLFAFGDVDGAQPLSSYARNDDGGIVYDDAGSPKIEGVQLQHALGVVYHNGHIYVADTYNNKIKVVNARTGETRTLAGTGEPGKDDESGTFDEPAGIGHAEGMLYVADTNNHQIRTVDPSTGEVKTLDIVGLTPPNTPLVRRKPSFAGAKQLELAKADVKPIAGAVKLDVQLELPVGWKVNSLAPMGYYVESNQANGPVDRAKLSDDLVRLETPQSRFEISLPVKGNGTDIIRIAMTYYYCQDGGEGLCKVGSVVWTVPLNISDKSSRPSIALRHVVLE